MKRFAGILIAILVIYVIYYDLSYGTLPSVKVEDVAASKTEEIAAPFFEESVRPGDTVLSIVEKRMNGTIPVSISSVIEDFQKLNDGRKPEDIQIGKTYKFPVYKK